MKFNKLFIVSFVAVSTLLLFSNVSAQYDADVIEPRYEDGAEIFGIDTEGDKNVSIYPEGCKTLERIVISLKGNAKGDLKVTSTGEKSPFDNDSISKAYEYCELKFEGVTKDNVNKIIVDTKVRKSWLSTESVDEASVSLYTFDNGWKNQKTTKGSDNSIYVFYTSEIGFAQNIAVGEYKATTLPFGLNPWILLICCVMGLFGLLLLSLILSAMGRNKNRENQY